MGQCRQPVFCPDEGIRPDFRGGPPALLESRSGAERRFNDHYLDIDYDLQVFFIALKTFTAFPAAPGQDGDHSD
jgi:ATP-dependent Lon protease